MLDGPGDLLFYNATIDSIGKMYFGGTPSDRTLNVPVYFTTTAAGSVGLFWGGHLASGTATSWGVGNGSASVGGAPYHMRVIDFDGGGGANQDRSIQNGSVCLPPTISLSCTPADTLCEDSTYSCSVASGADSYLWSVSGGTIASGQGTNSITYTVTASAGGTVTVTVTACNVASGCSTSFCCSVDTVNLAVEVCNLCPVASCPGDTSIYLCSPQQVCIPGFSCSDANGNLVSCTAVGGTLTGSDICFTPTTSGVYTLKLIALDGDGCADTCETQITVSMNQPPVANCPGDTTVYQCTLSQICVSGFSANDPDSNLMSTTVTGGTLGGNTVCLNPVAGPNVIRLIALDSCGVADTCETVVTVILNNPPVALCPGDTTLFVCDLNQICLPGFSASDPDGNLQSIGATGGTYASGSVCFTPVVGVNVIRLIAVDSCGAADTCETEVTVAMNNPPVATCPGNQTIFVCNLNPICIDGFSCDDPDGNGTSSTAVGGTLSGTQICFTPVVGPNTLKLICEDACGLADTCEATITVVLNSPPDVALGSDYSTSQCSPQAICVTYTVTDPNNNAVLEELVSPPPGATIDTLTNTVCFTPSGSGPYTITVKVTDACGLVDQDSQVITVQVNQPPTISMGNDSTLTLCQAQSICVGYSVSDPDGLAGLLEELVSGPAGATIDTSLNRVCFTPAASGSFTIIAKITDPCGLTDRDTVVVQVTLNDPPVVQFGPDENVKLCSSGQLCRTYTVSDPNGLTGVIETMISGPAGAILDTALNRVCFTPAANGVYSIIVRATDPCGAFDQDTIVLTVTINSAPSISLQVSTATYQLCMTAESTICIGYNISDPDGTRLVETLVSGGGIIDTAANTVCLPPTAGGSYTIVVRVTDSCGLFSVDTATIVVNRFLCCPSIAIEKVHNVLQGLFTCVDVTMQGSAFAMGGFDLLIAYDASALTLSEVLPGSFITDCGWEYFTYRVGAQGNCDGACPSGLVRIVSVAETNNGANHPSCYGPNSADSVQLAQVCFLVSNDRTLECQYAAVRFFWYDCGDNAVSTKSGDTLLVSDEVFDFDNPIPINDGQAAFPTYQGAPDICLVPYQPGKPALLRCIDFYNGGVDIVCADSIDARGDLNLNGFSYEIADAVLFSNYFVKGLVVFTINAAGQIAASDANADGLTLSVADLVYLIRVVIGDATPYDKLSPTSTTYTHVNGTLSVADPMGAALVVARGEVHPALLADNMEMLSEFDGTNTRILVYPSPSAQQVESFSGEFLSVNAELVSIEFGSACGAAVTARLVPGSFMLSQNYPNPFNPSTTIEFSLVTRSRVSLAVYDLLGHEIRLLVSGEYEAGRQSVEWDGRDGNGNLVGSGVYFYRLDVGGIQLSRKMVLLK